MKKSTYLIFIIANIFVTLKAQQIHFWDDGFFGFGIADLSNCQIIKQYTTTSFFPGGTLNIFQIPDGRMVRSNETTCGFLNTNEPVFWTKIKGSFNRYQPSHSAIAITCNSRSQIIIAMSDRITRRYLMYFNYNNGIFDTIGDLKNIQNLRSILAIGTKLFAFEEKLTPYRSYNFLEVNLNDLTNHKVLMNIDSSYWVKDYNPNHISPSFRLFKSFESCDSTVIYISAETNNDSTSRFYRINLENNAIEFICLTKNLKELRGVDGINSFGFLNNCRLDVDLDINNSTDSLKNYSTTYNCPQTEQKIHDVDWIYYSDGPMDSLRVEISTFIYDPGSEYLIAKYLPTGVTIVGNGTTSLLFVATKKIYTSEIEKILDGIVYFNDKIIPNPGLREIRSNIYIPWFEDTVYTKITVPIYPTAGRDTTVFICPVSQTYQLEKYLEHEGSTKGRWLEDQIAGGIFTAGVTPAGKYHFLADRGNCAPDSAVINIQYYDDLKINLGNDTIMDISNNYLINLNGDLKGNEIFRWYKNDSLLSQSNSSLELDIINDLNVSVEVLSQDGCTFKDVIYFRIRLDGNEIWLPEIFSPNNDNVNDILIVKGKYSRPVLKFEVYDRWGNLVYAGNNFKVNDESNGWNGEVNQQKAIPGVYVYYLEYLGSNGQILKKAGNVVLIR